MVKYTKRYYKMTIPEFPSFRDLAIEDKKVLDGYFLEDPPVISEFTFTNIYSWRDIYGFKISMLDGSIILCSTKGRSLRFFEPIGKKDKIGPIEIILAQNRGEFIRIPETTKVALEKDGRFYIELDEADSDYLYKTDDLILLKGAKYDGKRNLIRKFKSAYRYEYVRLTGVNAANILDFETEWCVIKDCDGVEGLNNERLALKQMVANFAGFGLLGAAINVDDKVSAVAIGERLNSDTMVLHIMKARPDMPGLYQTINNEFLSREAGDFKYVNMEQDLGVEGLRRSKQSYHPFKMIYKYTVRLKDTSG